MNEQKKLETIGRIFLAELDARSMRKPLKRDADGYLIRTNLWDGLARDGFYALIDAAEGLGLLDKFPE